jgi:hypothetical protein
MIPVPGYPLTTPYGRRGPYWSCDRDSHGNGIHTGADYAAPAGSTVVAARPGEVVYCDHGSAFGSHQLEILPGDGTRDFYAHMNSRHVPNGIRVQAGDRIGNVGTEGNTTGSHLHFERHSVASGGWSCSIVRDPAPSINYQPAAGSGGSGSTGEDEDVPKFSRTRLTKRMTLRPGEWTTIPWDTISSGDAGNKGDGYITFGPSPFTATLQAVLEATGAVVRTRFLERTKNDAGTWQTAEEYQNVEHALTSGGTYIADTRTQNIPAKGTRLLAQINLPDGGTLESAELSVLYF